MANYCFNELTVQGSKSHIDQFLQAAKEKNDFAPSPFSLQSLYPIPQPEAGLFTWQDDEEWAWEHWGTGCDLCEFLAQTRNSENEVSLAFLTRSLPCIEAFTRKIAPDFPHLTFQLRYSEPDMHIRGAYEWQNGKIVKEMDRSRPRLRNRK